MAELALAATSGGEGFAPSLPARHVAAVAVGNALQFTTF